LLGERVSADAVVGRNAKHFHEAPFRGFQ
jgi:hypothetical protein